MKELVSFPLKSKLGVLIQSLIQLEPVTFEHVFPERFDFLNMATFAVHRNPCQEEAFCELAFKADLLLERTRQLLRFVFAQPERAWQAITHT